MEWQQIIGFYHVARLGNFTRAAEATFRTQSALSQQIKSLEKELDCLLFERIGKRKLCLTAAGEEFLQFSAAVLEKHELFLESLNELKGLQKGHLKIAAPFTTLYHVFPFVLKDYVTRFPHVQLTILDRPQKSVIDLVKSGDIDFGFALESAVPENFAVFRWREVETVLMAPMGHPLTEEKHVTLMAIAQYPLILPPKGSTQINRPGLEERLAKLGVGYHVAMESSNVELSALYVEMGLGVSFATMVKDLPLLGQRNLEFISLAHYFEADYVALVARRTKNLPSYKSAFINMVLKGHSGIS
ncbi:MAG: LysR family transcriptional regulator [Desulfomonile tiedjei]|nr:LysR family transcriptional regulator [Desulfomonile tiedjei]